MNRQYRHPVSARFVMIAACYFMLGTFTHATPLYQQQVESAKVTDKALQKARKQIDEHVDIKLQDKLALAPFHKRDKQIEMAKQPICMNCHLPLPHRKNERSRSFMNMHSRYIACETCHLRPDDVQFSYQWLAYDGPLAGTTVPSRNGDQAKQDKTDKATDKPVKMPLPPYKNARIAPFLNAEWVISFKDSDFAKQIARDWKEANDEQRARLKVRIHAPLKEEGPACQACHGKEKPMLDLSELGATSRQKLAIQRNTVVRFFERYKKDDERIRISYILK